MCTRMGTCTHTLPLLVHVVFHYLYMFTICTCVYISHTSFITTPTDEERIGAKRKKKLQHFSNFFGDGGAGFGAGGGMGGLGRGFFGGGETLIISTKYFTVGCVYRCTMYMYIRPIEFSLITPVHVIVSKH